MIQLSHSWFSYCYKGYFMPYFVETSWCLPHIYSQTYHELSWIQHVQNHICVRSHMEVSWVIGLPPVIIHFWDFPVNKNQPAIGYPHLWNPRYIYICIYIYPIYLQYILHIIPLLSHYSIYYTPYIIGGASLRPGSPVGHHEVRHFEE